VPEKASARGSADDGAAVVRRKEEVRKVALGVEQLKLEIGELVKSGRCGS